MKNLLLFACLLIVAVTSGCATHSVPVAESSIHLNLNREEVTFKNEVKGEGTGFTIFPFYLWLGPAYERAEAQAMGNAMEAAFADAKADFIFQPRTKSSYINLLLFDFSSAEVVGKGVTVN